MDRTTDKLASLPYNPAAEARAAHAEHETIITRGALLSIAELTQIAGQDDSLNLVHLSCLITAIAERLSDSS